MDRYRRNGTWVIYTSFFIAIILQIMPWPSQLYLFRPSWVNLLLIYWVVETPNQVSVGTGFVLGLIVDIVFGSTLGIHALTLSILSYLVTIKHQLLRNTDIWLQTLVITITSLITQIITSCIEFLVNKTVFHIGTLCGCVIDGILWPVLFLLIRRIS